MSRHRDSWWRRALGPELTGQIRGATLPKAEHPS